MTGENDADEYTNGIAKREHTLFVQVQSDVHWTEEQMDNLVESIDSVTGEDIGVMVMTDDIEMMTQEQVEEYVEQLTDALE